MKHLLFTLSFLLAGLSITGQREIKIQSSVLGNRFVKAHILTHNADNELMDRVTLQPPMELPKYLTVKVPGRDTFHAVTIILVRDPDGNAIRNYNIQLGTIWDNQQDTIRSLLNFNLRQPVSSPLEEREITLTIKNVGKLDDLYSPSIDQDLFASAQKKGQDYTVTIMSYPHIGRTLFAVNKKDKKYRQITLPADQERNHGNYEFDYRELPVHQSRQVLTPGTSAPYLLYLSAINASGSEYLLYRSPNKTYDTSEKIHVDIPVNLSIESLYALTVVSDVTTSEWEYTVRSEKREITTIKATTFADLLLKEDFVKGDFLDGYTINSPDTTFDVWSLFYPIRGFVDPGLGGSKVALQNSWWSIKGYQTSADIPVFLPQLPSDLARNLLGEECRVITEYDNWAFSSSKATKYDFSIIEFRWHQRL